MPPSQSHIHPILPFSYLFISHNGIFLSQRPTSFPFPLQPYKQTHMITHTQASNIIDDGPVAKIRSRSTELVSNVTGFDSKHIISKSFARSSLCCCAAANFDSSSFTRALTSTPIPREDSLGRRIDMMERCERAERLWGYGATSGLIQSVFG